MDIFELWHAMTIKSFLLSPWLTGLCHGERHRIALCLRHGRTRRNGQQGQLRTNNHQEPGKYPWTRILDKELLQICCWVGYKMVQSGVFFSACVRILHSRTAFFPLARLSQPFGQCLKPLQITDFYIFSIFVETVPVLATSLLLSSYVVLMTCGNFAPD